MDKNPEILKTIALLASDDQDTLESVVYSLSTSGNGVVDDLLSALSSPNENIRQNVASCLGLIREPDTIKNLFNLLLDSRQNVQVSASWALHNFEIEDLKKELNIQEGMADNLEKALKHSNWQIRWYGINILAREFVSTQQQEPGNTETGLSDNNESVINLLLPCLKDSFLPVRLSAIWTLEPLYNETIKENFIEILGDLNDHIRSEVALALGRRKERDAVAGLIKRVQYDLNDNVRLSSVLAFSSMGGESIKPALIVALNDKNEYVRAEAINGFITTNSDIEELEDTYLNALNDKSKYVFRNAIKILVLIGQNKTLDTLLSMIKIEKDTERIANIIEALGYFKDKRALKIILTFINNPNWLIKMKTAASLGKIGNKKIINILLNMLKDPNEFVKESAIIALGGVGTKKIISTLEKICDEFPYRRLGVAARKSINLLLDK